MRVRFPLPAPFAFPKTAYPMKKHASSILLLTAFGIAGLSAEVDCEALTQSVTIKVAADKSQVLEITSKEIAAAPGCSCEIVKAAIKASEAEVNTVAAIVEAAITAAPDQMRLISQCAIASAPDAIGEVQAVLAKMDPNAGDSPVSSKSAKEPAKDVPAAEWNPLDFPGEGPIGPPPGTDGGNKLLRPRPPFQPEPGVDVVTDLDPETQDK